MMTRAFLSPVCCLVLSLPHTALCADAPKTPHQIINELQDRMYSIGETSGRFSDFVAAEERAAGEIDAYVASGITDGLVEKNSNGMTPVMSASFMGYPDLVIALLKSQTARAAIDDVSAKGISAWLYANLAYRQSMWICNPGALHDPFAFVPLFVTQPYYQQSAENPYKKIRQLLERAGAKADMARAKQFWQDNCKNQEAATRAKIAQGNDLLETVLTEGNAAMTRFISQQALMLQQHKK
jgi:ABC-type transport system substrate-binding protein